MIFAQRVSPLGLFACLLLLTIACRGVPVQAQEPQAEELTPVVEPTPEPEPPVNQGTVPPPADPPVTTPEQEDPEEPAEPAPLPPDEGLDVDALVAGLSRNLLWVLVLALVFGGAGGVVYELLILEGNIETFHKTKGDEVSQPYPYAVVKNLVDLGIWARVIIGGLAAVIAIWLLDPKSTYGLIAGSIIAGSAGTSVFRSLQDRLLATLAREDAAETRRVSALQQEKLEQALESVRAARGGGPVAESGRPADPSAASLAEAERLLTEARGVGETIGDKSR